MASLSAYRNYRSTPPLDSTGLAKIENGSLQIRVQVISESPKYGRSRQD